MFLYKRVGFNDLKVIRKKINRIRPMSTQAGLCRREWEPSDVISSLCEPLRLQDLKCHLADFPTNTALLSIERRPAVSSKI